MPGGCAWGGNPVAQPPQNKMVATAEQNQDILHDDFIHLTSASRSIKIEKAHLWTKPFVDQAFQDEVREKGRKGPT